MPGDMRGSDPTLRLEVGGRVENALVAENWASKPFRYVTIIDRALQATHLKLNRNA